MNIRPWLEEMSQQNAGHKYDARYRNQKPHVSQHRSSDVWYPPRRSQRADVQVVAKEVFRVVLRLELPEPRVIRAVDLQGRISGFVVIQIVQVARRAHERPHGFVGVAGPLDAALGVLRISPLGDDRHVEAFVPEGAGGISRPDPGYGPVKVLDDDLRRRRTARLEAIDHGPDALVAQFRQKVRLPVVERTFGVGRVE